MLARLLIERKRDHGRITSAEWRTLMERYGNGDVPDYQMAALAMAVFLNGLDREETGALVIELDLAEAAKHRASMGFFRDRRPQLYGRICEDI